MKTRIVQSVLSNIKNIPGWRTARKIVVIESDDWGSIRMPSLQVYNAFIEKGFPVNKGLYNRYDCLENETDLFSLFEVLSSFKDINTNPVIFTANCIVANPDFDKIRLSGFNDYYYELITDTIRKYPGRENVISIWKEGLQHKIFKPQSHGREHVNIQRWMKMLKKKDERTLFCFDHQTTFSGNGEEDYNFMEALDYDDRDQISNLNAIVEDGLLIFNRLFGYSSKSFIAPSYIWHSDIEPTLNKSGVRYLQGLQFQFIPKLKFGEYKRRFHYLGERNQMNQLYIIRNCSFEPAITPHIDSVSHCLKQIETAFRWNKPAVITSHRVNYIGALDESNRTRNLLLLRQLLSAIQKKWPEVEFMSTDELGDLIAAN
jgi:hypothetical protein